jgi:hypothetical protein
VRRAGLSVKKNHAGQRTAAPESGTVPGTLAGAPASA